MDGRLVLQVALREEARQILRAGDWRRNNSPAFPEIYEGRIGGGEVVLAISGVGRVHAEAAINEVLRKYRPSAVLSLGFGGALLPGQRAGDLIVAHTTVSKPMTPTRGGADSQRSLGNERLEPDWLLRDEALRVLEGLGLRHRSGVCITTSDVVSNPDVKRRMGLVTEALAVDMESFWVGLACRKRDVPFLAVRSILDVVEHPIPPFAARFASDAKYGTRLRMLALLLRPRSLLALVRLAHAAFVARNSLTTFVVAFLNSRTRNGAGVKLE